MKKRTGKMISLSLAVAMGNDSGSCDRTGCE